MDFKNEKRFLLVALAFVLLGLISVVRHAFMDSSNSGLNELAWEYEGTKVTLNKKAYKAKDSNQRSRQSRFEDRLTRTPRNSEVKLTGKSDAKKPINKKKIADAKKKAAEAAKKKKEEEEAKKKEGEAETSEEIAETEQAEEEENEEKEPVVASDTPPTTVVPGPPGEDTDDNAEEVSFWLDQFKSSPTKTTLLNFLSTHNSGEISDQTFYQVIEEMMLQPSPTIQDFAVNALEVTRTVKSFERLVQLALEDAPSGRIAQNAKRSIDRFAQPGGLKVLREVIANTNSVQAIVEATRLVRKILEDALNVAQRPTSRRVTTLSTQQQGAQDLYELLPLLRNTLEESNDPSVTQAINQTIQALEQSQNQFPFEVEIVSSIDDGSDQGQF